MQKVAGTLLTIGIVLLAAIILVAVVAWPYALDPSTSGAVSAVSTVAGAFVGLVAALGSLGAAWAAMRAAERSDETSERAMEALGLTIAPKIMVDSHNDVPGQEPDKNISPRIISVWNASQWPAHDVMLCIRRHDGLEVRRSVGRLEPSKALLGGKRPLDCFTVEFPMTLPKSASHPDWRGEEEWEDTVLVEYSDERGLLHWRARFPLSYHFSRAGGVQSAGAGPGGGWGKTERVR